jgi:hypothetical protein
MSRGSHEENVKEGDWEGKREQGTGRHLPVIALTAPQRLPINPSLIE